ncbi:MAG: DUF4124 domain-containing protein [Gammaproteobacteria bacterium]|nr:MAG: DUF4124 domain-containing protein [Gammaproteobacteria bacterium]
MPWRGEPLHVSCNDSPSNHKSSENLTMHAPTRSLIVLATLAFSLTANAQGITRYKWKDAQGAVQFTDTLPPEALQSGYDVVDSQGMVVKHVDRARTAEEHKADADAAAVAAAAKQRADDQARTDQQLLLAYSTESELVTAQQGHLAAIDQSIKTVRASQIDQEKSLSEQTAHAATFERDGKPVPVAVKQQIETLRKSIADQTAFIARKQAERANIVKNAEDELAHYRSLRAKQGQ